MGIALVLYVAFPTAPPRFMPEWGFTTRSRTSRAWRRTARRPTRCSTRSPRSLDARRFALCSACRWRTCRDGSGQDALAAIPPRVVRGRRDRQPLVVGRVLGRAHRGVGARGARVRALAPAAWAWPPVRGGERRCVGRRVELVGRAPPSRQSGVSRRGGGGGAGPSCPRSRWNARERPSARDYQVFARDRLIDSRLTPNAISLTGFILCVVAAS